MIARKQGGSIVQISSICSTIALPICMSYSATKAALDQMMKVMALEWGPHQVQIIHKCVFVGICVCTLAEIIMESNMCFACLPPELLIWLWFL